MWDKSELGDELARQALRESGKNDPTRERDEFEKAMPSRNSLAQAAGMATSEVDDKQCAEAATQESYLAARRMEREIDTGQEQEKVASSSAVDQERSEDDLGALQETIEQPPFENAGGSNSATHRVEREEDTAQEQEEVAPSAVGQERPEDDLGVLQEMTEQPIFENSARDFSPNSRLSFDPVVWAAQAGLGSQSAIEPMTGTDASPYHVCNQGKTDQTKSYSLPPNYFNGNQYWYHRNVAGLAKSAPKSLPSISSCETSMASVATSAETVVTANKSLPRMEMRGRGRSKSSSLGDPAADVETPREAKTQTTAVIIAGDDSDQGDNNNLDVEQEMDGCDEGSTLATSLVKNDIPGPDSEADAKQQLCRKRCQTCVIVASVLFVSSLIAVIVVSAVRRNSVDQSSMMDNSAEGPVSPTLSPSLPPLSPSSLPPSSPSATDQPMHEHVTSAPSTLPIEFPLEPPMRPSSKPEDAVTPAPSSESTPPPSPITTRQSVEARLEELVGVKIHNETTPHHEAFEWMMEEGLKSDSPYIEQRFLLALLYFSTDEGGWAFCARSENATDMECEGNQSNETSSRWLSSDDECKWFGIKCDAGFVRAINLTASNLTGGLPSELAELPHLQSLSFIHNRLEGIIPPAYGSIRNLQVLDLEQNFLSGPIPEEIYDATNLVRLNLGQNNLTGTVSPSVGRLTSLEHFLLDQNSFRGTVPAELVGLKNLRKIFIHFNDFTGTIRCDGDRQRHQKTPFKASDSTFYADCGNTDPKDTPRVDCDFSFYADCGNTDLKGPPRVECDGCCTDCCDTSQETCMSEHREHP